MSTDRARFSAVLDGLSKEWKEAKCMSQWDPDDGQYLFRVTSIDRGESSNNGGNFLWWKVNGYIECPDNAELHGHEWFPFYFTSKWLGFMKDFLKDTVGKIPEHPREGDTLIDQTVGWLLLVDIQTVTNKKTGRVNKNKNVLRVVERTVPEATVAA